VAAYKEEVKKWVKAAGDKCDARELMREGAKASVEAVAKLQHSRKRPVIKDGWAPLVRAYGIHLGFLLEVRRRLQGQAGRAQ
jgi:hypothetical protein